MNPVAVIEKKRDGGRLEAAEIARFVDGFTRGEIPDYQMAALAMAVYFQGMDAGETAALVEAMLHSGDVLQWPADHPPMVDKHSTGGVGDKTSLVIAPLLACCDLNVPMLSGRGLGPTGGTLDKLESIPGFRTDLSANEIREAVKRVGCVITGASKGLVPADRKLYALRDVTATVPSIPLICASVMSKKLAEKLDALVLDVKWGSGAFMKRRDDARRLAQAMVDSGAQMGVQTTALVTDMNQPLGRMVGNAVEVNEALEVLRGGGPADCRALCIALAAELLLAVDRETSHERARKRLSQLLASGAAMERFERMVAVQGGDLAAPREVMPAIELLADRPGYVSSINAHALGMALIEMGAGRKKMGEPVDHAVGLEMLVRLGDQVERGQPIVRLFVRGELAHHLRLNTTSAIGISDQPAEAPPLVVERINVDAIDCD